jgi:hypothetical protein
MDHSFEFAILQASPDDRRGERVNVGVVVVTPNGLDVRLPEVRKLRALSGHGWEAVAEAYRQQLVEVWDGRGGLTALSEELGAMSQVFALARAGTLRAAVGNYEERLKNLLDHLVVRPVLTRGEKQEKINSEISKVLKKAGVLGRKGDTFDDYKVMSRFVVSAEKEIVADFAYKGASKIKVVSTLDLRGAKSAHGKACEKGATLYFAKEQFGDKVTTPFGLFAASPVECEMHSGEIEILKSFADGNAFNWANARDRQRFQHAFY